MSSADTALWKTAPILVIVGPSGVGKTTLIDGMVSRLPGRFAFPVVTTTRKARLGERDGVDYNFVSKEAFSNMQHEGAFVFVSPHNGENYGLTIDALSRADPGKIIIVQHISAADTLDLKASGVLLNARYVIIAPLGDNVKAMVEVLKDRLIGRGTDDTSAIQTRLNDAEKELSFVTVPGLWDRVIVNDDRQVAIAMLAKYAEDSFRSEHRLDLAQVSITVERYGWAIAACAVAMAILVAALARARRVDFGRLLLLSDPLICDVPVQDS